MMMDPQKLYIFSKKATTPPKQLLRVAFTHFLSSNPPVCQNWGKGRGGGGGGQANLGTARILRAFCTVTPPLLSLNKSSNPLVVAHRLYHDPESVHADNMGCFELPSRDG